MKKILYTFTLAGCVALASSCVDLTQEPRSFSTVDGYFKLLDQPSLEKFTTALYNDLWGGNYGFNCRMQSINVCADDVTYRAAKPDNRLGNFGNLSPDVMQNDADVSTMWDLLFKAIDDANAVINKTVFPDDEKQARKFREIVGEAYFVRGFSFLYLTRLFGDVPLVLNEEQSSGRMPRTSVAEVYDKAILPSLQRAVEWLPASARKGNPATPSQWAAKLCLADAYMSLAGWPLKRTESYAKAAELTKDIIDNSGLKLTEKYADIWKEENKNSTDEVMFALLHSVANKSASQYGKSYYPSDFSPNAGWADYYGNEAFYLNYPDDERKAWNYMVQWKTKKGLVQYKASADKLPAISKYYDYNDGAPGKSQLSNGMTCIYRYAEALLTYAEASVRATGQVNAQALAAIQAVQKRAGYADGQLTDTTDPTAFLKAVSDERGWEFFAEMKRWFELVRLEKASEVKPAQWENSLFKAQKHYYLPIPYQQIQLTGWSNNAGY